MLQDGREDYEVRQRGNRDPTSLYAEAQRDSNGQETTFRARYYSVYARAFDYLSLRALPALGRQGQLSSFYLLQGLPQAQEMRGSEPEA